MPSKVLKPEDYERGNRGPWRPQLGFNPNRQQAHLDQSGFRALGHSLNRNQNQQFGGQYSNAPPPSSYHQGSYSRPAHSSSQQHFQHSRQNVVQRAAPAFSSVPPQPPRQQQPYRTGGQGWDRALQAQPSAYQQNLGRGGAGPGGYQQRYDQRRDDWGDRRGNRGQQQHQGRGYPPPPPSQRYHWN